MTDMWVERAQSAEAKLKTAKEAHELAQRRYQEFKSNFGIREKQGGVIEIDYLKFATFLGLEGCIELRATIDEVWQISGSPGEKARIKLMSAQ